MPPPPPPPPRSTRGIAAPSPSVAKCEGTLAEQVEKLRAENLALVKAHAAKEADIAELLKLLATVRAAELDAADALEHHLTSSRNFLTLLALAALLLYMHMNDTAASTAPLLHQLEQLLWDSMAQKSA